MPVKIFLAAFFSCVVALHAQSPRIQPPPPGKLYHGFYWGGVGTDTHDPTEHDVTAADMVRYEQAVGAKTAWVYFSHNWFESRKFPAETCGWIRDGGVIPYIRLMLRSDVDQKHAEKRFSLQKIIVGEFDADLRAWASDAKTFGSPILIEWGTEPNGGWFSWNGKWNAFENYFPGTDYCDWVALSAYGPLTPRTDEGLETFRFKIDEAYPRLTKVAPGKPVIVAELGCDLHNRHVDVVKWTRAALDDLFSNRWPAVVGFCWWNEGWQNDNHKKHDTDMIVLHDVDLTRVFRDELVCHREKIQEMPLIAK